MLSCPGAELEPLYTIKKKKKKRTGTRCEFLTAERNNAAMSKMFGRDVLATGKQHRVTSRGNLSGKQLIWKLAACYSVFMTFSFQKN